MDKENKKVVIIGAGLAGLRIAQILARKGLVVELVESHSSVGGMLRTIERFCMGDDYRFDLGPHLFFKEYLSVYESLLGAQKGGYLTPVEGDFVITVRGRALLYPLKIMNMLTNLPVSLTRKIVWDVIQARLRQSPAIEQPSVRDWMSQRFGDTLFDVFFAPYIEKCTGLATERVSPRWATERTTVTGENLIRTLIHTFTETLRRTKSVNLPSSRKIVAYYPIHGAGQIPLAMASEIERDGGKIRLNTRFSHLILENSRVNGLSVAETGNHQETIQGDVYVSTIPLPDLLSPFSTGIPAAISDSCRRLRFRQLLLVNLIVDRAHILDHLEVFYADREFPFKRIYEPKKLSPHMAPKTRSSLVLEICISQEDAADLGLKKQLIDRSITMLEGLGILRGKDILDCFTIILPAAYPIYDLAFERIIATAEDFLGGIPNLISCGRQGLFEYHAMTNETMEIAENVAYLILSGKSKSNANRQGKWSQYFY
jgi:protoporphyrinogen oxidase